MEWTKFDINGDLPGEGDNCLVTYEGSDGVRHVCSCTFTYDLSDWDDYHEHDNEPGFHYYDVYEMSSAVENVIAWVRWPKPYAG